MTTTKPRSDSASSRNDLFNTSWAPEIRPPKPLAADASPRLVPLQSGSGSLPRLKKDHNLLSDLASINNNGTGSSTSTTTTAISTATATATVPSPQHSRTSSFFDKPTELPLPPSRQNLPTPSSTGTPSPLNLSRASSLSLRNRPPPLPLDISSNNSNYIDTNTPSSSTSTGTSTFPRPLQTPPLETEPLSPLHQSPSLPAIADWNPPRPPTSDDISLRFSPKSMFLLGEGRYATVYLASYRKDRKEKGRQRNPYLPGPGPGPTVRVIRDPSIASSSPIMGGGEEVNEEGDGYIGGSWRLCAAKRMAPDRQSQTMGLREAFFLNRLSTSTNPSVMRGKRDLRSGGVRPRAVSPLREGFLRSSNPSSSSQTRPNGSVYVVKLVAVKEDLPPRTTTTPSGSGHNRSVSDAVPDTRGQLVRQRSSTMMNRYRDEKLDDSPINSLNTHPSLPSLAKAAKAEIETAPALSRLVLVLEHAPLGTMDRFLRTSPGLVGKRLWERWAVQTTDALSWVHGKGIVHADIKAGNLLLTANLDIRISDFGSSLLIHPSHPPMDGVGLGTLPFSPPELVDPESSFSFPVDIFSLGATLYQCLTGREPYRGCRTIEMMHHVRKGGLWNWEERERLSRIGQEREESVAPSPYPSAWRTEDYSGGGVRRAGSLRVPNHRSRDQSRPKLGRMGSTESLRASEDVGHEESPAAVKLWGKWVSNPRVGTDPVSLLLAESEGPISPTQASSRPTTLKSELPRPVNEDEGETYNTTREPTGAAYSDGSPAMFFLDGQERVNEEIRTTLRAMLLPQQESRPSADIVKARWADMGMSLDTEEDGDGEGDNSL